MVALIQQKSLIALLILGCCASASSWHVGLYSEADFKGNYINVTGQYSASCVDLASLNTCDEDNNCTSSIETTNSISTLNSCVRLFSSKKCSGSPMMVVRPGTNCHSNWTDCGLRGKVRSIDGCYSFQEYIFGDVLPSPPFLVEGTIQSPNYPQVYDDDTDVNWIITTLPGHKIQMGFTDFDIESSSSCSFDKVTITEFNIWRPRPVYEGCGKNLPAPIISLSNQIRLQFTTDESKRRKGFSLNWKGCNDCTPTNGMLLPSTSTTRAPTTTRTRTTSLPPSNSTVALRPNIGYLRPGLRQALLRIGLVTFHTGEYFTGNSYSDNLTPGCNEMPPYFRRNVASVNDGWRVICFYSERNCRGDSISTENLDANLELANLTSIGWNDKISSWKSSTRGNSC